MRRLRIVGAAFAAVVLVGGSTPTAQRPDFSYSVIEVPRSLLTNAFGINAGGAIVGAYMDGSEVWHGYVLHRGQFTTIDYPGAVGTDARGIGPGGAIVGTYWLAGEPAVAAHGYLRTRDGSFVPIDYPGHLNTIAQRILPDGTILGCRHDNDTTASMKGVTIGAGGFSEIDAFASMHNGATPDGTLIVGLYRNMAAGRTEAYAIADGEFTAFTVPGSIMTAAWDVNARGEIAGVYSDSGGFHGFVRRGDSYTSVDVPGAVATRAFGINAAGDVVGAFSSAGRTRGYLASRAPQLVQ